MSKNWNWAPKDVDLWLSSMTIATMTFSQQGIFENLLCRSWGEKVCGIPADREVVLQALIGKRDENTVSDTNFVLDKCFVPHPENTSMLVNPQQLEIWTEQRKKSKRLSKAGRKGGRNRLKPGLSPASKLLETISKHPSVSLSYLTKKEKGQSFEFAAEVYFTDAEFQRLPEILEVFADRNRQHPPSVFAFLADFAPRKAESRYEGRKQSDLKIIQNWGAQAYFDAIARAARNLPRGVPPTSSSGGSPAHPSHRPFASEKPKSKAEIEADRREALKIASQFKLNPKPVKA